MDLPYNALDPELNLVSRAIAESRTRFLQRQPPPRLYHYTDTAGLLGILTSSRLWATHYRYLNDAAEVGHGVALFEQIVQAKADAAQEPVVREFLRRTLGTANALDGMSDAYVVCFCEDDDLLNQWRAYGGRDGGYAVGFESRFIGLRQRIENLSQDFMLRRVEYDEQVQRELITEVIDKTAAVLAGATEGISVGDANNAIANCCRFVRVEIIDYFLCFKHGAFKSEQEWRLCHVSVARENPDLCFRGGAYGITPYVCLDPSPMAGVNANRLPVCSIRHGPTHYAENVQFGLKKLLRKLDYAFVDVSGTALSVRFGH